VVGTAPLDKDHTPPIDVIKAVNNTMPGIIAHQSAMQGGVWLDIPEYG
jgi:hypothetical protein